MALKGKLENKKMTIKTIIEKKIEDNLREVNKWKDLLFTVVDECIDEKINKLSSQVRITLSPISPSPSSPLSITRSIPIPLNILTM